MRVAYERGLDELGDGLYANLQPDGTWGWSNAGLIAADGTSLLVDTLFDLELTREMLDAMRRVTERSPIDAAMNTHGNGDHCVGNGLLRRRAHRRQRRDRLSRVRPGPAGRDPARAVRADGRWASHR